MLIHYSVCLNFSRIILSNYGIFLDKETRSPNSIMDFFFSGFEIFFFLPEITSNLQIGILVRFRHLYLRFHLCPLVPQDPRRGARMRSHHKDIETLGRVDHLEAA